MRSDERQRHARPVHLRRVALALAVVATAAAGLAGARGSDAAGPTCTGAGGRCVVAIAANVAGGAVTVSIHDAATGKDTPAEAHSCTPGCLSTTVSPGSVVTLRPTAPKNGSFIGFRGSCSSLMLPCRLVVKADTSVAVSWGYTVFVKYTGTGEGVIESTPVRLRCRWTCSNVFTAGALVTLRARPSSISRFAGWSVRCAHPQARTCRFRVTPDKTIGVRFEAILYALAIRSTGGGAVVSKPGGISCGRSCSAAFRKGLKVTLRAKPARNRRFAGWGGACRRYGKTPVCRLKMTAAYKVSARFRAR